MFMPEFPMTYEPKLLTRDQFREGVFRRDGHKCVFCGAPAADAHHIIERRLWGNGGYYMENGASVCEPCHMRCETTEFSVELVREKCGITKIVVPSHMYKDTTYDKWGNPVLPNGQRLKGELFFDESVQKVIAPYLSEFTTYAKYPRTHHLPWSPGLTDDDRVMPHLKEFEGQRVIVTTKMDGENTTMYRDHIHARSVDSGSHPTRSWVQNFHAGIAHDIPEGWRICGENMFAEHSIYYPELPSYLLGFSIWNERNVCLAWDETLEWFQLFGITPVPVIYDGVFDEKAIKALYKDKDWATNEGYVIRVADSYSYGEFRFKVGKFVRQNHVNTAKHWMMGQAIKKNGLRQP